MNNPNISLVDVNNNPLKIIGCIYAEIKLDSYSWMDHFFIVDNLPVECLLGLPTMQKQRIDLLMSKNAIQFKKNVNHIPFSNIINKQ
jgi:hypothetical protein